VPTRTRPSLGRRRYKLRCTVDHDDAWDRRVVRAIRLRQVPPDLGRRWLGSVCERAFNLVRGLGATRERGRVAWLGGRDLAARHSSRVWATTRPAVCRARRRNSGRSSTLR
jgi:hypothetical protein